MDTASGSIVAQRNGLFLNATHVWKERVAFGLGQREGTGRDGRDAGIYVW